MSGTLSPKVESFTKSFRGYSDLRLLRPRFGAPRGWQRMSDSHVRPAAESEVLAAQAFLLFYERFSSA